VFFKAPPFIVTLGGMFFARGMAQVISLDSIPITNTFFGNFTRMGIHLGNGLLASTAIIFLIVVFNCGLHFAVYRVWQKCVCNRGEFVFVPFDGVTRITDTSFGICDKWLAFRLGRGGLYDVYLGGVQPGRNRNGNGRDFGSRYRWNTYYRRCRFYRRNSRRRFDYRYHTDFYHFPRYLEFPLDPDLCRISCICIYHPSAKPVKDFTETRNIGRLIINASSPFYARFLETERAFF